MISGLLGGVLVVLAGRVEAAAASRSGRPARLHRALLHAAIARGRRCSGLGYGLVTLPRDVGGALLLGVLIAGAMAALAAAAPVARLSGRRHALDPAPDGRRRAGLRLRHRLGADRAGLHPHGRLARRRLGLPHRRRGHQPRHFTTVWKVLGRRTALLYLLSVAASAVVCGLLLDQVFAFVHAAAPQLAPGARAHEMTHGGWLSTFWAVALLAVLAFSYFSALAQPDPRPAT